MDLDESFWHSNKSPDIWHQACTEMMDKQDKCWVGADFDTDIDVGNIVDAAHVLKWVEDIRKADNSEDNMLEDRRG